MYEVEGVEPPEPTHPKSYTPFSVWNELSLIHVLSMQYSQLSPCGHLAITDTTIIRTAAKPQAKKVQMFGWNRLPLLRTLANEDNNSRSPQCPL